MIFGTFMVAIDTLAKKHTHVHKHVVTDLINGEKYTHIIEHEHEHNHYLLEDNHNHSHNKMK